MFVLPNKSRRRVRTIPPTDCTALSAAPFESLLCAGEVRGVAAVNNAHASWMTALSACSESPWMITLGCPTCRANAAHTAICKQISVSFLLKRNGNHLFLRCVHGHQGCDRWSIFLCLQDATVALDDGREDDLDDSESGSHEQKGKTQTESQRARSLEKASYCSACRSLHHKSARPRLQESTRAHN